MTELLEKLGIRSRHGIEAFIERLIGMLDDIDPDPDFEPWLGWNDMEPRHGIRATDDREGYDEREFDPAEDGIADQDGLLEQLCGAV